MFCITDWTKGQYIHLNQLRDIILLKPSTMNNYIKWIDFKTLERTSVDKNFGLLDFLFFGSRRVLKLWWYMLIPLFNFVYAFVWLFYFITFPLRWYLYESRMKKLREHAYDIEDTDSCFRLIRNRRGYWGVCEWGESYELCRKVILDSEYVKIERWHADRYIVTDKNYRMGVYSPLSREWVIPCTCKSIEIESGRIIKVTQNNRTQRYNLNCERVIG